MTRVPSVPLQLHGFNLFSNGGILKDCNSVFIYMISRSPSYSKTVTLLAKRLQETLEIYCLSWSGYQIEFKARRGSLLSIAATTSLGFHSIPSIIQMRQTFHSPLSANIRATNTPGSRGPSCAALIVSTHIIMSSKRFVHCTRPRYLSYFLICTCSF